MLLQAVTIFLSALTAFGLSSPPSGAITIGNGGKYSTLSKALADTSSSTYFIYSGTYTEQVLVTQANIKIYGQTNTAGNYTGNTVTLTFNANAQAAGGDDPSGTLRVHADNVSLYNVNVANSYGQGTQAIALSVQGEQFGAYGVQLTGYQDTFYANVGSLFVSHSLIKGATDFIFGQRSSLWIQNSIIQVVGNGYITASGRSTDDTRWFVINQSTVTGSGSTYLGRPWRNYARVVFQNTYLPSIINSAGWVQWSSSTPNTDHVTFAEYQNSGPGASGNRASFSTKLGSAVALSTVFPSGTSWIDSAFLT